MIKQVEAFDVYRQKHLVDIADLSLSIHVYGLAIQDDKILIVLQYDGYDFPGGTLEIGETHLETLVREFHEETGLNIEPVKFLKIYDSFFRDEKYNISDQSILIFYLVRVLDGKISDKNFDDAEKNYAKKAEWKTIEELHNMRQACSLDISAELLAFAQTEMKNLGRVDTNQ